MIPRKVNSVEEAPNQNGGASLHMCNYDKFFKEINFKYRGQVVVAKSGELSVKGLGTVVLNTYVAGQLN